MYDNILYKKNKINIVVICICNYIYFESGFVLRKLNIRFIKYEIGG